LAHRANEPEAEPSPQVCALSSEKPLSLRNLVGSVDRVNTLIADLSQAAVQQGEGIGQINQAITQLDGMTQQNAALVEESTAAAESLKQQAMALSASVAAFKVRS